MTKQKTTPHHAGHRQRLRQRFMRAGVDSLQDYELLELILFSAIPRSDVKPLAKDLLNTCGDISAVIGANPDKLRQINGVTENVIIELKVAEALAQKLGQSKIMNRPTIGSWDDMISYCRTTMAEKDVEEFRVLFLDRKNNLIADDLMGIGTVDHAPVYPREIMKRALIHSASALIIVHNHPSGDPTPSKTDIKMTNIIKDTALSLGIVLHDHLIIAKQNEMSFKNLGLL